jgi:hypothetical protein
VKATAANPGWHKAAATHLAAVALGALSATLAWSRFGPTETRTVRSVSTELQGAAQSSHQAPVRPVHRFAPTSNCPGDDADDANGSSIGDALAAAESRLAMAETALEACGGGLYDWPEELVEEFGQPAFSERFEAALELAEIDGVGVSYSCDEFPCLAVVRGGEVNGEQNALLVGALKDAYGADIQPIGNRHLAAGKNGVTYVGVYSVYPTSLQEDERLRRRVDLRIKAEQQVADENARPDD